MKNLLHILSALMPSAPMDAVGIGVIDFKKKSFEAFEANQFEGMVKFKSEPTIYFDLASLTKVLTNSLTYFLDSKNFDEKMLLCLSHRGGLPSWGLLPKSGWKEQILSYEIKDSPTLYSDFSALRVLLEYNKKSDMKTLCQTVWDKELMNWLDLPAWYPTLQYGQIGGKKKFGIVHDPNALTIGEFTSHAGLFSTTDGLCRTLLNYQDKTNFIQKVFDDLKSHNHRFSFGWDRVVNPQDTLAGSGCGKFTFGHLGFTGTSIWIDPEKMLGHVILSNTVKEHWYDKTVLNDLRRALGEKIWTLEF